MRKLCLLALALVFSGWLIAADPSEGPAAQGTSAAKKALATRQADGGKLSAAAGFLSAVPTQLTGASCSGPRGTATLNMTANPFVVGQWIAVREVPPSAPIVVSGEKVGTGDGSTTTFTFRTANYPIQRGSVSVLVGGASQGVDHPGEPYPGIGELQGPGVGTFQGTVTISGGTGVTLTSTPAVFDSRWQAFLPTIDGKRGRYIIGSGIDATHLKLMAPAEDGAGQSFTLDSQINYFTGVIEVTFTSAPGCRSPLTTSLNPPDGSVNTRWSPSPHRV